MYISIYLFIVYINLVILCDALLSIMYLEFAHYKITLLLLLMIFPTLMLYFLL